jgi:hypothetical protein
MYRDLIKKLLVQDRTRRLGNMKVGTLRISVELREKMMKKKSLHHQLHLIVEAHH